MAVLHLLMFFCVSLMGLMLIPLLFIRVPRIALHFVAEKKKDEANSPWRYYEREFRKWSSVAYFPIAFIFQIISGCAVYCKTSDAALIAAGTYDPTQCRTGYVIWFLILLLMNIGIDFAIWHYIVEPELKDEIAPVKGATAKET
jgi:hypothetical protein